ncbi:MAG: elongation factor G [Rhodospirillales bacterium]|nr:elongation factor G [Rhodospirillales bacterium]
MASNASTPRCAAIVGPYLSGKTTLLEALLFGAGAISRKGNVTDGSAVGDRSQESRDKGMSTELNIATMEYLGEKWALIDCPGSVELMQEAWSALMVVDTAIVVCEPSPERAVTVAPILKFLDDHKIPHVVFINRMDTPGATVRGTFEALQSVSARPLVLREIPIRDGDELSGFVDLVSERAYRLNSDPAKPSDLMQMPDDFAPIEKQARAEMLEALADFDDSLLEELLEDVVPSTDEIYDNLTRDLHKDLIVPVFFGSAANGTGITRLLKVLRHEAPDAAESAGRLGIKSAGEGVAQVFKTLHAGHAGKLSLARIWGGDIADGDTLNGGRVGGVFSVMGQDHIKQPKAVAGEVVALGRIEGASTGDMLKASGGGRSIGWPDTPPPLFSLAIHAEKQGDDVKLSGALHKLVDEDPSLSYGHDEETGEFVLSGQGEVHLKIALAKLENRFGLKAAADRPQVPYKETIRKPASQHSRHKKQSGGHGEFGDVHLEIKPLQRGEGFVFSDTITGGVVPKQYIPGVEAGVVEYLKRGPLGFQVVDISVTLTDGSFHTVDSSDMAFRKAAGAAMREAMPNCGPVLLEPVCKVTVSVPNEFTPKIQRMVTGRRGQLLGFDVKEGWNGWDEVQALMPQAEMQDMIVELRSQTLGVGTYGYEFDHLQELTGKDADQVVAARSKALGR